MRAGHLRAVSLFAAAAAIATAEGCQLLAGIDSRSLGAGDAGDLADVGSDSVDGSADGTVDAPGDAPSSVDAEASAGCAFDQTSCNGACVDTRTDSAHCGDCTTACTGGTSCVAGHCSNPYYISPTGSDSASGTSEAAPWKTFAYALTKVGPGDALVLLDGTYTAATTGLANVDCTGSSKSGLTGYPIVLAARHERQAIVASDGSAPALHFWYCSGWVVDGLTATMGDLAIDAGGLLVATVQVERGSDIELHRLLVSGNNRYVYSGTVSIDGMQRALLTDTEIYGFNSIGLSVTYSADVDVMRIYANSRNTADIAGGRVTNPPDDGDRAVEVYGMNGGHSFVENVVTEGSALGIGVDQNDPGATTSVLGSIALAGSGTALAVGSYGASVKDVVAAESGGSGLLFTAFDIVASNLTLVSTRGATFGGNGSVSVSNSLVFGGTTTGFQLTPQPDAGSWVVESSNAFGSGNDFAPAEPIDDTSGLFRSDKQIPPTAMGLTPGKCVVYVPPASNMKGAGKGGADIGANVIYRYEKGAVTTTKLWLPDGRFPCGAIVAGINDVAHASCSNVHERLNFVAGGCPVP